MPSITATIIEDEPSAREPAATCDACGRTGTHARVIRGLAPGAVRVVQRYCWRCWPTAYRRTANGHRAEMAAWFHAGTEAATSGEPEAFSQVQARAPAGMSINPHWTAWIASLWDQFCHGRVRLYERV